MDEGIGFRYAPKRYALRAPLGLRSSRRPHPFREERKQQTETAFRKTQLQNLTHTTGAATPPHEEGNIPDSEIRQFRTRCIREVLSCSVLCLSRSDRGGDCSCSS